MRLRRLISPGIFLLLLLGFCQMGRADTVACRDLTELRERLGQGGTVRLEAGVITGKMRITKPVRIVAVAGPVRIGVSSSLERIAAARRSRQPAFRQASSRTAVPRAFPEGLSTSSRSRAWLHLFSSGPFAPVDGETPESQKAILCRLPVGAVLGTGADVTARVSGEGHSASSGSPGRIAFCNANLPRKANHENSTIPLLL